MLPNPRSRVTYEASSRMVTVELLRGGVAPLPRVDGGSVSGLESASG